MAEALFSMVFGYKIFRLEEPDLATEIKGFGAMYVPLQLQQHRIADHLSGRHHCPILLND